MLQAARTFNLGLGAVRMGDYVLTLWWCCSERRGSQDSTRPGGA